MNSIVKNSFFILSLVLVVGVQAAGAEFRGNPYLVTPQTLDTSPEQQRLQAMVKGVTRGDIVRGAPGVSFWGKPALWTALFVAGGGSLIAGAIVLLKKWHTQEKQIKKEIAAFPARAPMLRKKLNKVKKALKITGATMMVLVGASIVGIGGTIAAAPFMVGQ